MKKFRLYIISFVCFWSISTYPAAIIFDLDGILIERSGFSAIWNIGLRHFFGFYNPNKVQKKMFEFFNTLEMRKPETPWSYNQNLLLPQLVCDWLMGLKTNQDILKVIQQALYDKKYTFSKKKYHKLTQYIAELMFTPERLADVMRPIKGGVDLLKLCKRYKHQTYILSNWDPESFELLRKKKWFKDILDNCDGYVISGSIRMMKPDPCIFQHLFKTYNIDPDITTTVFIDDNRENIIGAHTLKKKQLYCFECNNKNFENIKQELQKLCLI